MTPALLAALLVTLPDGKAPLQTREATPVACEAPASTGAVTVDVDTERVFQPIDGFGAAMTESSAIVLDRLPRKERKAALDDLYGKVAFLRVPIGASDFSDGTYSCDDVPAGASDPGLRRFDLQRCAQRILPYLKDARRRNPRLKLVGTAWSAPAWMKDSGTMKGGSLSDARKADYARYLARFAGEMRKAGVPLDYLTISNEPGYSTGGYPTMTMAATAQIDVIAALGPALAAESPATKILAWDHNWGHVEYPLAVFASTAAARWAAGAAFHCYEGDPSQMDEFAKAHPDKEIQFTECSAGGWEKRFDRAFPWAVETLFIGDLAHGARSVLLWNLALDDHWGPTNGGCLDCRGVVTVHQSSAAVEKTPEYYALAHAAAAADQGARRVYSVASSTSLAQVAFANPGGGVGWLAYNGTGRDVPVRWRQGGRCLDFDLPAGAAATLRRRPAKP